ncbi:MAG: ABC transporter ATP-binding protein [Thermoproteota archaeon]|nr:ABC transporter ATP-binding protein [Thermoproteota archaeon]
MALIVAEGLAKNYGKVVAVDGLDLTVKEESIMGLIGPNGAGKTTTIKMILGLLKPDRGRVEVFGEDPWDNPDIRPLIGVVHERAFFPAHQRVLNYLERVCRIFGVPESRAVDVLKLVNLQEAYDREIKALSAGMLQKFAIAHALLHEPKLVIADELTANLDPKARSDLLDLILKLHQDQNVAFLLSSHILPELSRVCDSVAIIGEGKVRASGELSELYEKYTAGIIRIFTDKPEELAGRIKTLPYLKELKTDSRGISVRISNEKEGKLYEDVPKLARKLGAKILGIETGSASLEELYRLVISSESEAS